MKSLSVGSIALLLSTIITTTSGAGLGKPVLAKSKVRQLLQYYQAAYDNPLVLPSASKVAQVAWPKFNVPLTCTIESQRIGCMPGKLQAYNVTYADCPNEPWTFCYCESSVTTLSLEKQIHFVGQIPVGARIWVRTFHSLPNYQNVAAYAVGSDIAATSDFSEGFVTLLHELIHVLDRSGSENSAEWAKAVKDDSCVITEYANTSLTENYAELGTLLLLDIIDPEGMARLKAGLKAENLSLDCLSNQWNYVDKTLRGRLVTGGTCGKRIDLQSKPVWTVPRLQAFIDQIHTWLGKRDVGQYYDVDPKDVKVIWD
ncbi:hypothetical protein DFH27DRAFT_192389 [Peziza echinospora]|nr:hypothetical protein DFH27DRAFT_192389 [Peziza echinospora]